VPVERPLDALCLLSYDTPHIPDCGMQCSAGLVLHAILPLPTLSRHAALIACTAYREQVDIGIFCGSWCHTPGRHAIPLHIRQALCRRCYTALAANHRGKGRYTVAMLYRRSCLVPCQTVLCGGRCIINSSASISWLSLLARRDGILVQQQ
jgi:hypothetical protein